MSQRIVAQWRQMAYENLIIIGSGNNLSPVRGKAISWTKPDLW